MIEGLERALIIVEKEIEVAKEYGTVQMAIVQMAMGMQQIKTLLKDELKTKADTLKVNR